MIHDRHVELATGIPGRWRTAAKGPVILGGSIHCCGELGASSPEKFSNQLLKPPCLFASCSVLPPKVPHIFERRLPHPPHALLLTGDKWVLRAVHLGLERENATACMFRQRTGIGLAMDLS
ncbi:hypothetical protein N7508_001495 [Penicillium antarcticum]|uniref:uncharacterized protein n=1 Tax=Penicillium antarcticum TaxID=416450 RepID=UPI002391294D|nr:uncharacterized protein N7508_001495 [Penicillium antarcticum]KAJ5316987.1 hypothetical protein N7508_001495 [Penicillium antarcticum]